MKKELIEEHRRLTEEIRIKDIRRSQIWNELWNIDKQENTGIVIDSEDERLSTLAT